MKFSICIPTYEMHGKGCEFLSMLLDSIEQLSIDETDRIEVVVSDHSINSDIDELSSAYNIKWCLYFKHLSINYVVNHDNRGSSSANLNNAMRLATGDVIKPMFQDDFFFNKNTLKHIKDKLFPNRGFVIKWGMVGFNHKVPPSLQYINARIPYYNPMIIKGNNTMGSPSGLFFFGWDIVYGFDEKMRWLMDCELYYRLYEEVGEPIIISQTCVTNTLWDGQLSNVLTDQEKAADYKYIGEKHEIQM